jgi:hypothetical protein
MLSAGFQHSGSSNRPGQSEVIYEALSPAWDFPMVHPLEAAADTWLVQGLLYDGTAVGSPSSHHWGHWSECWMWWRQHVPSGC